MWVVAPAVVHQPDWGLRVMADEQPVFTGAELALADTLILLMKVMAMHGVIERDSIDAVFNDMMMRYRGQHLHAAAAMAEYLRHHTTDSDGENTLVQLRTLLDKTPEGNA